MLDVLALAVGYVVLGAGAVYTVLGTILWLIEQITRKIGVYPRLIKAIYRVYREEKQQ